jgi:transitional endoplasmic reticulum ATPase
MTEDVNLDDIAKRTEGYTGADIAALVNEAVMLSIRQVVALDEVVTPERIKDMRLTKKHFDIALANYKPRLKSEAKKYEKLVKDFEYVR